jgi:hypothetical protein
MSKKKALPLEARLVERMCLKLHEQIFGSRSSLSGGRGQKNSTRVRNTNRAIVDFDCNRYAHIAGKNLVTKET